MKRLIVLAVLGLGGMPAAAADPDEPAKQKAAENPPRAAAMDETAVRKLLGKNATITGKVTRAFASGKGVTFLDLDGGKFTVVCWKDSYDKFEGGNPANLYRNKDIEVTGEVFEYKKGGEQGKLEIKLTDPAQIQVIEAAAEEEKDGRKKPDEAPAGRKAKPETKPAPDKKPEKTPQSGEEKKPERVDPKKYFR